MLNSSPAAPKRFPSMALNPFQLFLNLVSLRGQFLDQLSSFCTVSLSLLLSVTIPSFITTSLMRISFINPSQCFAHSPSLSLPLFFPSPILSLSL